MSISRRRLATPRKDTALTRSAYLSCTILALALGAAVAPAAKAEARLPAKLAAMTAEHARERVVVVDDRLEFEAVISSEPVFRSRRGLLRSTWNDNHLRAVVDKRSGAVRFEVRQAVHYQGTFRGYDRVNYPGAQGLVGQRLTRLGDTSAQCLGPDAVGCPVREDVAFTVEERALRQVAAEPSAEPWSFKFKAAGGPDHLASLSRAEIAGLLQEVDSYLGAAGLPQRLAAAPTSNNNKKRE
jgi:hypothetical protein